MTQTLTPATTRPAPLYDADAVVDALKVIVGPGNVTEIRVLDAKTKDNPRWSKTLYGYFDDPGKVAEELSTLKSATGIYFIFNQVNPDLLGRAYNRLREALKGASTSDKDITRRCWLLIDCDKLRPAGISATDKEHDAALKRAQEIRLYLFNCCWPDPIVADSGNGGHLIYCIDLPGDDDGLVERCLKSLAAAFDDADVKVDVSVSSPAQLSKLYGTLACKGDITPDRPHRMSRIISRPEVPQSVAKALLEGLAGPARTSAADRNGHQLNDSSLPPFDMPAYIAEHGFDVAESKPWNGGGTIWQFNTSPLCEHHEGAAFIGLQADGAIFAGCHHNSCAGLKWAALKEKYPPGQRKPRTTAANDVAANQGDDGAATADPNPFKSKVTYARITSAELAKADYAIEFQIENMMAAKQPLIIAGPPKSLKTFFILDGAVSLAVGGKFLRNFKVTRPCRVMVMTGESGLATIQENALSVCRAAGCDLGKLENLFWSTDLPKFGDVDHVEALERFLSADGIEVLFVDPAYLCMPGSDAGNLMIQGELLRSISEVCQRLGVTLVLAHHTKKHTSRDPGEPPELSDIAWSGFAEFARQWWLVGRREIYTPGTGHHKLWLSVGGSAGHSGLWAVDVDEGHRGDPEGRRWQVSVTVPGEARAIASEAKNKLREQAATEALALDKTAARRGALAKNPEGMTKTAIRDAAGIGRAFERVLASLIADGTIEQCDVYTGNQKTAKPGYRITQNETF